MIYGIISKNTVPISQMHIYLKNKTGNDGGQFPEIFNDISLMESVNGLYAFAIGCVLTNNFTESIRKHKEYPSNEVAVLALVQYIKGMATTVQLSKPCVSKLYQNLVDMNKLGSAPSLLNLDGDLFLNHYDTQKYFSKEAADEAEDSFPYWVINTIKEIEESNEIIKPKIKSYALPYYIQNISNNNLPIIKNIFKDVTDDNIIGYLPSSGTEAVLEIKNGYGKLASSENAYILLTDELVPMKHMITEDEIDDDDTITFPENEEFDIIVRNNIPSIARYGTNIHYKNAGEKYTYGVGTMIHITKVFHKFGVVAEGIYISLKNEYVMLKNQIMDHTKEEEIIEEPEDIDTIETPRFSDCEYLLVSSAANEKTAFTLLNTIYNKSEYNHAFIDIDGSRYNIVIAGEHTEADAKITKKKIIGITGCKTTIVKYNDFYK